MTDFSFDWFRTFDGRYNNLDISYPEGVYKWGMAGSDLIERGSQEYDFTFYPTPPSAPKILKATTIYDTDSGIDIELPNALDVSHILMSQEEDIFDKKGQSLMTMQWGQFLDHDMSISPHEDDMNDDYMMTSTDDSFRMFFNPSKKSSGKAVNDITAYLDASMLYGSSKEKADDLRMNDGTGKMAFTYSGDFEFLPVDDSNFFVAGDVRVNEQPGLTAMHALWLREHNRIADLINYFLSEVSPSFKKGKEGYLKLKGTEVKMGESEHQGLVKAYEDYMDMDMDGENPKHGDFVFYMTREVMAAKTQRITYEQFLPSLIGDSMERYEKYDPTVNPSIADEFSTVAFRFGHTMLPEKYDFQEEGETLKDVFFRDADYLQEKGVGTILSSLSKQRSQAIDPYVVNALNKFLFAEKGKTGFSLPALNIQRGRDHGNPLYPDLRELYGLKPVSNWSEFDNITGLKEEVVRMFKDLYKTPDNIDPWVGGLAEKTADGSALGPLFTEIVTDQFQRLRDGDRSYYKNNNLFVADENGDGGYLMPFIKNGSDLEDIIENNTNASIDGNPFMV